jgi:hypothetical protein
VCEPFDEKRKADAVAVLRQLVVNALPAGAVDETAVNENDGPR